MPHPNSAENLYFAGGPLILTFAEMLAETDANSGTGRLVCIAKRGGME
jgi:hypothetical protein